MALLFLWNECWMQSTKKRYSFRFLTCCSKVVSYRMRRRLPRERTKSAQWLSWIHISLLELFLLALKNSRLTLLRVDQSNGFVEGREPDIFTCDRICSQSWNQKQLGGWHTKIPSHSTPICGTQTVLHGSFTARRQYLHSMQPSPASKSSMKLA